MAGPIVSVRRAQHFAPGFTIYGRIAAKPLGKITRPLDSLHLSLAIYDGYSTTIIDGQPTMTEAGWGNFLRIRTSVSTTMPSDVVVSAALQPPAGMSAEVFALSLLTKASQFASYTQRYSFPKRLGETMGDGKYNSSSYLAGLLRSVMGHVPHLDFRGYQIPGWESPVPLSAFKGEAIR